MKNYFACALMLMMVSGCAMQPLLSPERKQLLSCTNEKYVDKSGVILEIEDFRWTEDLLVFNVSLRNASREPFTWDFANPPLFFLMDQNGTEFMQELGRMEDLTSIIALWRGSVNPGRKLTGTTVFKVDPSGQYIMKVFLGERGGQVKGRELIRCKVTK